MIWSIEAVCATSTTLATNGRLFAGLANGELWQSRDQGDSWTPLQLRGDPLDGLVALGYTTH